MAHWGLDNSRVTLMVPGRRPGLQLFENEGSQIEQERERREPEQYPRFRDQVRRALLVARTVEACDEAFALYDEFMKLSPRQLDLDIYASGCARMRSALILNTNDDAKAAEADKR